MPGPLDGQMAPPVETAVCSAPAPARTEASKTDRRRSAGRRPASEVRSDRCVKTDFGGSGRDEVPTERAVMLGPETRVLEISERDLVEPPALQ